MSDVPTNEINNYGNLVSIGCLDLTFTLTLTEEEANYFEINYDEIKTLKDCQQFLTKKFEERKISDYIGLTSTNSTINTLLFMNKANNSKTFVEFITLSNFTIEDDCEFILDALTVVTDSNFFFINYQNVYSSVVNKMSFHVRIEGKDIKEFTIPSKPNSNTVRSESEENINSTGNNNDTEPKPLNYLFDTIKHELQGRKYFYVDLNDIIKLAAYDINLMDFCYCLNGLTVLNRDINVIISFPNMIEHTEFLSIDAINNISEIFSLTDTFIFDRKEALELFELIKQFNEIEDNKKDEKNKAEWVFLRDIKKLRKVHPKIGIFFKELEKVSVLEQENESNLILFHKDFNFNVIPDNVSKVVRDDYRKLLAVNYHILKSTFLGGFLSRKVYKKSFKTCFTAGCETLKRVVELLRFNLPFPIDPKFYLVKIKKEKKSKKQIIQNELKKKEKQFILDCVNSTNSKLKEYKPLYDDNLKSYFSSFFVRQHLKKLGFINRKGVILEDPDIKRLGIVKSKKLLSSYESERKALLKMIEDNEKMKLQIENIFNSQGGLQNANLEEIEKCTKIENFNLTAQKKLPSITTSSSKNTTRTSNLYAKEVDKQSTLYGSRKPFNNVKPLSKENYLKIIGELEGKVGSQAGSDIIS
jgi:hypothetical protein